MSILRSVVSREGLTEASLETMEGKALAIDSSIWLYQFQATMRDKEGRALVNAHLLGFLRRICKLLYYGIKPVFVFDGGAPALKRTTLNERRKKKSGAADTHVRVAERLLAAQLRREALKHVSQANRRKGKSVVDDESVPIDDSIVYMEDLEGRDAPRTPPKAVGSRVGAQGQDGPSKTVPITNESSAEKKRKKWQDHDPYHLPEVDLEAAIANATSSNLPDPRLATEEELQAFIDEMRPEDFDINAEAFSELPTEVQYEIIGDLRLKSRQTSHKRLQAMLRQAETPLDFSKAQIQNLQKRNALTQQLLVTTNMVSRANLTIPVRVASERNREYVLVKNDSSAGGWILGIRDEGTQSKPIAVDVKSDGEDDVAGKASMLAARNARHDPDLREFRRQMALSSIGKRASPQKGSNHSNLKSSTSKESKPLFLDDTEEPLSHPPAPHEEEIDSAFAIAIHESLEEAEAEELRQAIEESKNTAQYHHRIGESSSTSTGNKLIPSAELEEEDPLGAPVHRELSTSTSEGDRDAPFMGKVAAASMLFGLPTMGGKANTKAIQPAEQDEEDPFGPLLEVQDSEDESMDEVAPPSRLRSTTPSRQSVAIDSDSDDMEEVIPTRVGTIGSHLSPVNVQDQVPNVLNPSNSDSDDQMEDVQPIPSVATDEGAARPGYVVPGVVRSPDLQKLAPDSTKAASDHYSARSYEKLDMKQSTIGMRVSPLRTIGGEEPQVSPQAQSSKQVPNVASIQAASRSISATVEMKAEDRDSPRGSPQGLTPPAAPGLVDGSNDSPAPLTTRGVGESAPGLEEGDPTWSWSRTPTPEPGAERLAGAATNSAQPHRPDSPSNMESSRVEDSFDAADEIDLQAEEGDFASLMSQVQGKDLDAARKEVDEEIAALNKERKAAMRDSEDVTQQMVGQIKILLRLFGIPYVTAPMEAEAQCAALVEFKLVDGVITDDSDIFLFGGLRVFRNMFNQSKTVECFLLSDLARELGLDRDTLVRLAYLLGSDYVEGLPGVGPVVAMEILEEFPGENGLSAFKEWWTKVQSGKDKEVDNPSKFRQRFKKKYKNLYLPDDWPNPIVRDAYYHPTIDESKEAFSWALPDIEGLRTEELGWNKAKVDETLLPIIKRVGQRGRPNAITKQSNLNNFFDITAGVGSYAPRQKQAYASKRLQKVVSDFRKKGKEKESATNTEDDVDDVKTSGTSKRKSSTNAKSRTRGSNTKVNASRKKRKIAEEEEAEAELSSPSEDDPPEKPKSKPRPRPRRANQRAIDNDEGRAEQPGSDSSGSNYSDTRSGKKKAVN
ncbi:DNA repair protein rad2 [Tulasnella sp. 417]|nr:DNA repair protein rad2 [Tulasnella sp. 417]